MGKEPDLFKEKDHGKKDLKKTEEVLLRRLCR